MHIDFYIFLQLLIVSITATSTMTLFSYAISKSFRELYKEPVLLSFILSKLKLETSAKTENILAWVLHYIIGLLFVLAYHFIWSNNILPVSVLSALLLGAISGIIGILGWMLMFRLSNHKPAIDFKGYYIQLFFAHVIFGLTAAAVYALSLTTLILA